MYSQGKLPAYSPVPLSGKLKQKKMSKEVEFDKGRQILTMGDFLLQSTKDRSR